MKNATSPPATSGLARALVEGRRRRGQSVEDAARHVRISAQYLLALEQDAPLSEFPAPVYARFFLREYARYLGLNEERAMAAFVHRHGPAVEGVEARPAGQGSAPSPRTNGRANGTGPSAKPANGRPRLNGGARQAQGKTAPAGAVTAARRPSTSVGSNGSNGSNGARGNGASDARANGANGRAAPTATAPRPASRPAGATAASASRRASASPRRPRSTLSNASRSRPAKAPDPRELAKVRGAVLTAGMAGSGHANGRSHRPMVVRPVRPALTRRGGVALVTGAAVVVLAGALILPRLAWKSSAAPTSPSEGVVVPPAPSDLPMGGQVIFPDYRVVAYYGAPHDTDLGILGIGPEQAAAQLQEQVKDYEFGSKPVVPAFEIIGTLATRAAGDDGMYRVRLPREDLDQYLAAARDINALFVVDVQPGRSDFLTEVQRYEDLLLQPDVGLALDPEWHVSDSQLPGVDIGSVDAQDVNQVVDWLAALVRDHHLPQKLLIIHQFTSNMITNKAYVQTPPELAVTFDVDGFGESDVKVGKYEDFSGPFASFYHGFKLFYEQDTDLMSPLQVLGLRPAPDFIVYQ
jgi:hypothetical protein